MASRTRLPPPKKKKNRITQPKTADEYLAVGVEHEEAAEKWRSGDAVKSLRFYDRALESYGKALEQWPGNFDVAYNKARVQFAVTQHPAYRGLLPTPLEQQLRLALDSHRNALKLGPDNQDALFNTAQLLSALADELDEDEGQSNRVACLEEAVTLLRQCLELQSDSLQRKQAELDQAEQTAAGASEAGSGASTSRPGTPASVGSDDETWATIEEPITAATLLETGTVIFDTLASLCKSLPDGSTEDLQSIEQASVQVHKRLQSLQLDIDESVRLELVLSEAKLKAAMLEAAFGASTIDHKMYDQALKESFEALTGSGASADALTAYAEALLDLATAIDEVAGTSQLRWNRTSRALDLLSKVTELPQQPDERVALHSLRGDIELFRHRLTFNADLPDTLRALTVRATLLANAVTYYRGAVGSARDSDDDAALSATIKSAVAVSLAQGDAQPLHKLEGRGISQTKIVEVLEEAQEELLLTAEMLNTIILGD